MSNLFGQTFTNFLSSGDFLFWLAVIIAVYFLLREFRCWYLKTNKIIKILEEINTKLNFLHSQIQDKNQKEDTNKDQTPPSVALN